jgi:hypothetical protein
MFAPVLTPGETPSGARVPGITTEVHRPEAPGFPSYPLEHDECTEIRRGNEPMRYASTFAATMLVVFAITSSTTIARADDTTTKQWVWLEKQGVWGFGYQLADGPHKGLWRIDSGSKRAPEPPAPVTDPYGFHAILNQYRASAGLSPLEYDHELAGWAAMNNAHQANRGLGHHVNPNCHQNCSWNTTDAVSTADQWLNSRGHRENMLSPAVRSFGVAYGPGPYWTLNLR